MMINLAAVAVRSKDNKSQMGVHHWDFISKFNWSSTEGNIIRLLLGLQNYFNENFPTDTV